MSDVAERLTLDDPVVEDPSGAPRRDGAPRTHGDGAGAAQPRSLRPGTRVEVRSRFDHSYARGFEVIDLTDDGYRLRRLSDGMELPAVFAEADVRKERRSSDMWWY